MLPPLHPLFLTFIPYVRLWAFESFLFFFFFFAGLLQKGKYTHTQFNKLILSLYCNNTFWGGRGHYNKRFWENIRELWEKRQSHTHSTICCTYRKQIYWKLDTIRIYRSCEKHIWNQILIISKLNVDIALLFFFIRTFCLFKDRKQCSLELTKTIDSISFLFLVMYYLLSLYLMKSI